MVIIRREVGDVLRERRRHQGRTLRQVSSDAAVSLGYLSEVERGEKEASSEMLATICRALELPVSQMLNDVAVRVAIAEAEEATAKAIEVIDAADLGDEDAELAVGDAQDNYMAFYDPSELPVLVELL